MGIGPVPAIREVLKVTGLTLAVLFYLLFVHEFWLFHLTCSLSCPFPLVYGAINRVVELDLIYFCISRVVFSLVYPL